MVNHIYVGRKKDGKKTEEDKTRKEEEKEYRERVDKNKRLHIQTRN